MKSRFYLIFSVLLMAISLQADENDNDNSCKTKADRQPLHSKHGIGKFYHNYDYWRDYIGARGFSFDGDWWLCAGSDDNDMQLLREQMSERESLRRSIEYRRHLIKLPLRKKHEKK